jgi:hypothetical protein
MERLKFYADNESRSQVNKLFTFKIESAMYIGSALLRFAKKVDVIRAAWYEFINEETGKIENRRIDLNFFYECLNDGNYKETHELIKFID